MNLIKNYEINEQDYLDVQPKSSILVSSTTLNMLLASTNDEYLNQEFNYQERLLNLLHIKSEMNSLQFALVLTGIIMITFGVVANLTFNLLILFKKQLTLSNCLMISMCMANLIYLTFYSFKISVFSTSITKYHVYDTIDPWPFGQLMCQLTSGLIVSCKLVIRLSILGLALVRILLLIQSKNRPRNGDTFTLSKTYIGYPLMFILLVFTWTVSLLAAIPIYSSFKLTYIHNSTSEPFCDSIYSFPDDLTKVSFVSFNYFLFGFGLPSLLILVSLVIILIMHLLNRESADSLKSKNNWLLVILFVLHLATTLPHDLSKYFRLSVKYELDDELFIDEKLLDTVRKPIQEAKSYYELQYLYVSEFVIIPFVLILFHVFSTKKFTFISSTLFKCCDCNETEECLSGVNNRHEIILNGADERLLNDSSDVRTIKVNNLQRQQRGPTNAPTATSPQSVSFSYMQSTTYKN